MKTKISIGMHSIRVNNDDDSCSHPRQRRRRRNLTFDRIQISRKMHLHIVATRLASTVVIAIVAITTSWAVSAYCIGRRSTYAHRKGLNSLYFGLHCIRSGDRLHPKRSTSFVIFANINDDDENEDADYTSNEQHSLSTQKELQKQGERDLVRRRRKRQFERWGVDNMQSSTHPTHRSAHSDQLPAFPSTFEEVAHDAFCAIAGTICGLQRPDPNAVSNAMHRSVLDYRPTQPTSASSRRWANGDDEVGFAKKKSTAKKKAAEPVRMGIEIDGAAYLLPPASISGYTNQGTDEGRAMRILTLEIARLLAVSPWDGFEEKEENDESSSGFDSGGRSVAIFYNSMDQALLASREFRRLKQKHSETQQIYGFGGDWGDKILDNIHICSLGHHSLPSHMIARGKKRKYQQKSKKSFEKYDSFPEKGIVLIVKPTDYDTDSPTRTHTNQYHPTIQTNIIDKLQSLLFQTSASSVPAVVISPRLTELAPLQQSSHFAEATTTSRYKTGPSGFEQSGYQRSATYGGIEPPVGPTPWLLRDLAPPVYVWVGSSWNIISHANTRRRKLHSNPSLRSIIAAYRHQQQSSDDAVNLEVTEGKATYSFYSRVALTQSTMDAGHAWNMFAVKESIDDLSQFSSSSSAHSSHENGNAKEKWDSTYHYMASTKASSGRPTSGIMKDVFLEWCENNNDGTNS